MANLRIQVRHDSGPIPEGLRNLAGGKAVEPSRPPVVGKMNFPPRMGRRNKCEGVSGAPAGAKNMFFARVPGTALHLRPG
jgi:hypothetical protein